MCIHEIDFAAADGETYPHRAARLELRARFDSRQRRGADELQRMVAEHGVAVFLFGEAHGGMEVEMHLELVGDFLHLVDAAGAPAADIALLQSHDVGIALRDHARNSPRRQSAVHADAGVDVVSQNADRAGASAFFARLRGDGDVCSVKSAESGGAQVERSQIAFIASFDRRIGRQQGEAARFLGARSGVSTVFQHEAERTAGISPAADDETAGIGMIAECG